MRGISSCYAVIKESETWMEMEEVAVNSGFVIRDPLIVN